MLWAHSFGPEEHRVPPFVLNSPAVAADGTIYYAPWDSFASVPLVVVTGPDGTPLAPVGARGHVLVIGRDGRLVTGPAVESAVLSTTDHLVPSFVLGPEPDPIGYVLSGAMRLQGLGADDVPLWTVDLPGGSEATLQDLVADVDGRALVCVDTGLMRWDQWRVSPDGATEVRTHCAVGVGPAAEHYNVMRSGDRLTPSVSIGRIGLDREQLYGGSYVVLTGGTSGTIEFRGMAIDHDGSVVVALSHGPTMPGQLLRIDPSGVVVDYLTVDEPSGPPAIDTDGVVYVGTMTGMLHAFTRTGTELFSLFVTAGHISSPAIGTSERVYVASYGSVFAIGDSP